MKKILVDMKNKLSNDVERQYNLVNNYIEFETRIKEYEKKLKEIKEELKKYEFDEITFLGENEHLSLVIKQFEQERKKINQDKLITLINNVTNSDIGEKLIEQSTEKNLVTCIKITGKRQNN